jgi:hypothetical protein
MKTVIVLVVLLLAGCSAVGALPTIKYCDHVRYERVGNKAEVHAEGCVIPMGTDLPGI